MSGKKGQKKGFTGVHEAVARIMLTKPHMKQKEIAAELGVTMPTLHRIKQSPQFKEEFERQRRELDEALREEIVEATLEAVRFSKNVLRDPSEPTALKQASARDILAQGHAKAIERSARLNVGAELPKEFFSTLETVAKELQTEWKPSRAFLYPEKGDEDETLEGEG